MGDLESPKLLDKKSYKKRIKVNEKIKFLSQMFLT